MEGLGLAHATTKRLDRKTWPCARRSWPAGPLLAGGLRRECIMLRTSSTSTTIFIDSTWTALLLALPHQLLNGLGSGVEGLGWDTGPTGPGLAHEGTKQRDRKNRPCVRRSWPAGRLLAGWLRREHIMLRTSSTSTTIFVDYTWTAELHHLILCKCPDYYFLFFHHPKKGY